jgi:hypothetical protein
MMSEPEPGFFKYEVADSPLVVGTANAIAETFGFDEKQMHAVLKAWEQDGCATQVGETWVTGGDAEMRKCVVKSLREGRP